MKGKLTNFLWVFLFASPAFTQIDEHDDHGTASITEELCVTLDAESPIQEFYAIDISHLDFESAKVANDRFGFISNNLLTYSVDFESETAYLQVHLDRTSEPKDIVWWNDYIESLCGLYQPD
jgi:hypothetical protein